MKEWHQCLSMLGDAKVDEHGNVDDLKDCNIMYLDKDGEDREINVNCLFFFFCFVIMMFQLLYLMHALSYS